MLQIIEDINKISVKVEPPLNESPPDRIKGIHLLTINKDNLEGMIKKFRVYYQYNTTFFYIFHFHSIKQTGNFILNHLNTI
jgi:hypothetical protein